MLDIVLLAAVISIVGFLYVWYRRPQNFPPGPRGLPLVGVLPMLGKYPEREIASWSKKYGSLTSCPMGWENWVVLNDYDIMVETLIKRSVELKDRPYLRFFNKMTSHGIIFPSGTTWRSHRNFGVSAMRNFAGSKAVMEGKVAEEARYLIERLASLEGRSFQIQKIITNAVANVICNIAFSKRYDYDDDKFQMLVTALLQLFQSYAHWITKVVIIFPSLCDVPPFSWHVRGSEKVAQSMRDFVDEHIKEHKTSHDPKDMRDMTDAYIQAFQYQRQDFVVKNCQDFLLDLFVAGTETTSSTLRWGFLCLMLHEDVQERMHKEIDRVIGKDGTPSISQRDEMPYTCAVIHEILRFNTLAPLSIPRRTSNDITVRGYRIPKGTNVFINLWNVHNDDTYWTDPEKFSPERHLDEDGNFTNTRHVMPFGAGARVCLGDQLARTELWIFLVSIIQKFRLSIDPNSPNKPSIKGTFNAFLYVPVTYDMIVSSR